MKYQIGDELSFRSGASAKVIGVRQLEGQEPEFVSDDDPYFWRPGSGVMGEFPSGFDVILHVPVERKISKADKVLLALSPGGEEYAYSFNSLMEHTGMTRFEVSACCRYLACEGYAKFSSGLMNYGECQVAGSGYSITKEGLARVKEWL